LRSAYHGQAYVNEIMRWTRDYDNVGFRVGFKASQ